MSAPIASVGNPDKTAPVLRAQLRQVYAVIAVLEERVRMQKCVAQGLEEELAEYEEETP